MKGSSQIPNAQPKYSLSELEINSAAMETAQIKDKLKKRRMSEGLLASKKGRMSFLVRIYLSVTFIYNCYKSSIAFSLVWISCHYSNFMPGG